MRVAACVAPVLLCALGCTSAAPGDGRVSASRSPIAYGTADSVHTAVVAVLAPAGGAQLEECTGTIVQVSGAYGTVLTAAHCCNTYIPTVVVVSNDYTVGESYVSSGTPVPPVYRVVPGSVYYDALYAGADHDFCMLKFSGATSSTPTIALPTSANDGLQLGSQVQHVGFGLTENGSNSQRRAGTDTVDVQLTPLLIQFSQGGASHTPGTCDGDSGGPSLLPATGAQSQQVVVAVQSYGNSSTCSGETLGGASRVSSEIGPGGFISSYLAGTPTGRQAGVAPASAPATGRWTLVALALGLLAVGKGVGPKGSGPRGARGRGAAAHGPRSET